MFICLLFTEEFNSAILTPELSEKDLQKLHTDLRDMYRNYCSAQAHDRIQFDDDIVAQLKESEFFLLALVVVVVVDKSLFENRSHRRRLFLRCLF